jgi:hypothetical protein
MKPGKLLIGYGSFLMLCGVAGWAAAGFTAKAKTAIASGSVTGLLMIALGVAALKLAPAGSRLAAWAAVGFATLFTGAFVWRASVAWGALPEKLYVAVLLSAMALASVITIALTVRALRGAQAASPAPH